MEFIVGLMFGSAITITGEIVVYALWRQGKFARFGFLPKPPAQ